MVGLGVWKTRGDPPIFFRTPPRGGVRKKKWGAKRKGGARTPRTPPEYAHGSRVHFGHLNIPSKARDVKVAKMDEGTRGKVKFLTSM